VHRTRRDPEREEGERESRREGGQESESEIQKKIQFEGAEGVAGAAPKSWASGVELNAV